MQLFLFSLLLNQHLPRRLSLALARWYYKINTPACNRFTGMLVIKYRLRNTVQRDELLFREEKYCSEKIMKALNRVKTQEL